MTHTPGWVQILTIEGPVPSSWNLDDAASIESLRAAVANTTLHGLPGGAFLEVLDDREQFRATFTVGLDPRLDLGALDRARVLTRDCLAQLGVEIASCIEVLQSLAPESPTHGA